jgi:hypothetical protein
MIKTEIISPNVLKISVPEKLQADDFRQIAPQINSLIGEHGKIRLLIDASGFNGWENMAAFEKHAGFVKDHQFPHLTRLRVPNWQQNLCLPLPKGSHG